MPGPGGRPCRAAIAIDGVEDRRGELIGIGDQNDQQPGLSLLLAVEQAAILIPAAIRAG